MTNSSKGSSSWVNKCAKWMPSRQKQDVKDTLKKRFLGPSLKVTFSARELPKALSEVNHFALSSRKMTTPFKNFSKYFQRENTGHKETKQS